VSFPAAQLRICSLAHASRFTAAPALEESTRLDYRLFRCQLPAAAQPTQRPFLFSYRFISLAASGALLFFFLFHQAALPASLVGIQVLTTFSASMKENCLQPFSLAALLLQHRHILDGGLGTLACLALKLDKLPTLRGLLKKDIRSGLDGKATSGCGTASTSAAAFCNGSCSSCLACSFCQVASAASAILQSSRSLYRKCKQVLGCILCTVKKPIWEVSEKLTTEKKVWLGALPGVLAFSGLLQKGLQLLSS